MQEVEQHPPQENQPQTVLYSAPPSPQQPPKPIYKRLPKTLLGKIFFFLTIILIIVALVYQFFLPKPKTIDQVLKQEQQK